MDYVFPPPATVTLPVLGSEHVVPVHRVYCVGRNYAAHAIEMGYDPEKEPPFFFQKSPDTLLTGGRDFPYPPLSSDVHHEIELAVVLGKGGENIKVGDALSTVFGYAVALDMTRRDLQTTMKTQGRPWEIGKSFEQSAPCSDVVLAQDIGHPDAGEIRLDVNGARRQSGDLSHMIWKTPELISELSRYFVLQPGDVILTGTPAGVGSVERGDELQGHIDGIGTLTVAVR